MTNRISFLFGNRSGLDFVVHVLVLTIAAIMLAKRKAKIHQSVY
jgi:hypothetical protein